MMKTFYIVMLFWHHCKVVALDQSERKCSRSNKICIPDDYDSTKRPILWANKNDKITNIRVSLLDFKIIQINDDESTITLWSILQMRWKEPRLKIMPNVTNQFDEFPRSFLQLIWLPDIYIDNVKDIHTYNLIEDYRFLYHQVNHTMLYCIGQSTSLT